MTFSPSSRQNALDAAARNIAPRAPTPLDESFSTRFAVQQDQTTLGVVGPLRDAYDEYIAQIEERTGERLPNPFMALSVPEREALGETEGPNRGLGDDASIEAFHRRVEQLAEQNPGLEVRSRESFTTAEAENRQDRRDAVARAESGELGLLSGIAGVSGTMAGALADPIVLGSLPFGAPWATGIVRAALIEAGIAGLSEIPVQAIAQTERQRVGEEADLGEAVGNVALVAAGGAVLGGGIRGAVRGVRALRGRRANLNKAESLQTKNPDLQSAIAVEARSLDIAETNPFPQTAAGQALHERRFAEATEALSTGRVQPAGEVSDAVRTISGLSAEQVDAVRVAAALEPAELARILDGATTPPRLSEFLTEEGGLADDAAVAELRALDERPELVREDGLSVDAAIDRAVEAGFFDERPTREQFLNSVRDNVPLPTRVDDIPTALREAGVDLDDVDAARVRVQELAQGLDEIEQLATPRSAGPSPVQTSQARATDQFATADEGAAAEMDALREQRVADLPDDARVTLEGPDGNFQTITARQLRELDAREASDLEAIRICNRRN